MYEGVEGVTSSASEFVGHGWATRQAQLDATHHPGMDIRRACHLHVQIIGRRACRHCA